MSARQFYIVFLVFVISLKVQKLPSIMYGIYGKDSFISILLYLVVNLIGILLAFFILKRTKGLSFMDKSKSKIFEILKKIILVSVTFYFLIQSLLMYESMQNLFEHTLFENLPWILFSLLLLFCIFYLAFTGIKNIALNFELYFFLIIASYILIAVLGGIHTDFSVILPLQTVNFRFIIDRLVDFNVWFGDFFLVLFLGKSAKNIKLGWTLLTYTVAILFVTFLNIEFAGIYLGYSPMQASLISTLSEQSMLGLNIGRVDWFLILMAEFGTILSCAVCFYFAAKSMHGVFPKIKFLYILMALSVLLYLFDIFVLKDTHTREYSIIHYFHYISVVIKYVVFIVLVIMSIRIKQTKSLILDSGQNGQESNNELSLKSANQENGKTTNQENILAQKNNNLSHKKNKEKQKLGKDKDRGEIYEKIF